MGLRRGPLLAPGKTVARASLGNLQAASRRAPDGRAALPARGNAPHGRPRPRRGGSGARRLQLRAGNPGLPPGRARQPRQPRRAARGGLRRRGTRGRPIVGPRLFRSSRSGRHPPLHRARPARGTAGVGRAGPVRPVRPHRGGPQRHRRHPRSAELPRQRRARPAPEGLDRRLGRPHPRDHGQRRLRHARGAHRSRKRRRRLVRRSLRLRRRRRRRPLQRRNPAGLAEGRFLRRTPGQDHSSRCRSHPRPAERLRRLRLGRGPASRQLPPRPRLRRLCRQRPAGARRRRRGSAPRLDPGRRPAESPRTDGTGTARPRLRTAPAALPEGRRPLAPLLAAQPLRRHPRRRNGLGQDPPDPRLADDGRRGTHRRIPQAFAHRLSHQPGRQLGRRSRALHPLA